MTYPRGVFRNAGVLRLRKSIRKRMEFAALRMTSWGACDGAQDDNCGARDWAGASLACAFHSCGLELVSFLPSDEIGLGCGFPSQGKSETRHCCVSRKVHVGVIFVAGLMIVFRRIFVGLLLTPCGVMAFVFHTFI